MKKKTQRLVDTTVIALLVISMLAGRIIPFITR